MYLFIYLFVYLFQLQSISRSSAICGFHMSAIRCFNSWWTGKPQQRWHPGILGSFSTQRIDSREELRVLPDTLDPDNKKGTNVAVSCSRYKKKVVFGHPRVPYTNKNRGFNGKVIYSTTADSKSVTADGYEASATQRPVPVAKKDCPTL